MALATSTINSLLTFSCLVGLGLSIYAFIVELKLENDANYSPVCDINQYISCSKAFKSEYGKGFGLFAKDSFFHKPNSLVGIFFYSLVATLTKVNFKYTVLISFLIIVMSNVASIYFAYILYFKLYDLCIVCVSIYVVNFVNLILIQFKIWGLNEMEVDAASNENKKVKKNK